MHVNKHINMTLSGRKKGRNNQKKNRKEEEQACIPPSKGLQQKTTLHNLPANTSVNPPVSGHREAGPEMATVKPPAKGQSQQFTVVTGKELIKAPVAVSKNESGIHFKS